MTWVVALTGPGEKDNHVELDVLARGLPLATVGGAYEWETRPEANAAQARLRERIVREAALEAGQKEFPW